MNVQVGQIWNDKDKRRAGRKFEVVSITNNLANCKLVANGSRQRIKIRLDRFTPKYYALANSAGKQDLLNKLTGLVDQRPGTLSENDVVANVLEGKLHGSWGVFGKYSLLDDGHVLILIRKVRDNCYDVKVRIDSHLVMSEVLTTDLETAVDKIAQDLRMLRDSLSKIVD